LRTRNKFFFFSFLAASDGGGKTPGGVTRLDYHVCTFIYDFFKKRENKKNMKTLNKH
jgi:hypothetical protein